MDTITHIALGACMGEVLARRKLGKKALVIGGIAQIIPDIDFIFGLWMDPASNALAHRGFTHSFLFVLIVVPVLAWFHRRWWGDKTIPYNFWLLFFSVQVTLHVILDAFNAYGTAWFEPFSHYRVSFHTLFVADPFFSIPVGIAFGLLILLPMQNTRRTLVALAGVFISLLYLGYGSMNKLEIDKAARNALAHQNIPHEKFLTTPTPFNNWLWFVVAEHDRGSYVAYRSVFDEGEHMDFQFFPRNDSLLSHTTDQAAVEKLKRFSQGYYTVTWAGDTLIFNDLRFGQMLGWSNPRAGFVFHYYLYPDLDNKLVLQRGRFAGWDEAATWELLKRIRGTKTRLTTPSP